MTLHTREMLDKDWTSHSMDDDDGGLLRENVEEALRYRFATGQITPDSSFSTRGLAAELGVSQMPVREALGRLAAEGAIEIRSKRRLAIPPMTPARFDDLLTCRLLLEPAAAAQALPAIDAQRLKRLKALDSAIGNALRGGDVISYMANNRAFHFEIYEASGRRTITRLIETLWLQFGPFMRVVYGRYGTANLVDQHQLAIKAIANGDSAGLKEAMYSDIADGMGLIGRSIWS